MIAIAIEGMIVIDKLDTSFVLRQDFRFKITNISQAPVLFPATIRYNLDLFNIYSYTELWGALEWNRPFDPVNDSLAKFLVFSTNNKCTQRWTQ
ncbi:probable multidrug resistance-associated protein lethal(2)03659 isoform X2 [Plodia interpunctella]|uniref:probable multidrug resistance-associated protein lethal(2)03659 isoform X2 n=1 Tax=Plodia interpunctella TaxID=58824 RepID=UPI0031014C43